MVIRNFITAATTNCGVEIVVSILLLRLAVLFGCDNWRAGIAWDSIVAPAVKSDTAKIRQL